MPKLVLALVGAKWICATQERLISSNKLERSIMELFSGKILVTANLSRLGYEPLVGETLCISHQLVSDLPIRNRLIQGHSRLFLSKSDNSE